MKGKGIYHLGIKAHFDAAHYLKGYKGKCASVHGHRFDVEVIIKGTELDDIGIIMDFTDIKRIVRELLENYDHSTLNEKIPFMNSNPTAENISRELFHQFKEKLPSNIEVLSVKVWESPDQWAMYGE